MSPVDVAADVELIRSMVAKYFPVYDVKVSYESVALLVSPDKATMEGSFESLRRDMKAKGFIPFINYGGGEYTISVVRFPETKKRSLWINRALLVITFITTALAGMLLWADYSGSTELFTLENFGLGALFFAIPLMTILGVHELSHYLMSKRHGLDASLPYFIPSIPPFGTFGAFISMKDPMPNRKALVQIGVAGPLGGLAVTIPVALIGLYLTSIGHPAPGGPVGSGGLTAIMLQPLYELLTFIIPIQSNMALHPTAFAAWVGFLVTAINLLPIGQLDGGHVARGLLGDKAKYLAYGAFAALVILALFFDGWLLFALLVFFIGLKHPAPLNDISKLDLKTLAVGVLGMVVLLATFVPQPFVTIAPDHSFEMSAIGGNNTTVTAGSYAEFNIQINNTGNTDNVVTFNLHGSTLDYQAFFWSNGTTMDGLSEPLPYGANITVNVRVYVSNAPSESSRDIYLGGQSSQGPGRQLTLTVHVA